jgi:hypothetical protein
MDKSTVHQAARGRKSSCRLSLVPYGNKALVSFSRNMKEYRGRFHLLWPDLRARERRFLDDAGAGALTHTSIESCASVHT